MSVASTGGVDMGAVRERERLEPGEVGAIQEGLADVIGQIFERSAGGDSRTAATVGERIWPNGHGRNLANPDRGLAMNLFKVVGKSNVPYPNHVEKQLCARVVNGKIVREEFMYGPSAHPGTPS